MLEVPTHLSIPKSVLVTVCSGSASVSVISQKQAIAIKHRGTSLLVVKGRIQRVRRMLGFNYIYLSQL